MRMHCQLTIGFAVGLLVFAHPIPAHAQATEPTRVDLQRRFVKVDTERATWGAALHLVLDRANVPFLFEAETQARVSRSMLHGRTEEEVGKILTHFKVHLTNVTLDDTIKFILKDQPNYRYAVVDGTVLHVYPVSIQDRPNWPLNTMVKQFAIEPVDITKNWYRGRFEEFVDPLRIDLGTAKGSDFARCLSPRVFDGVTLRQVLIELSKACRYGWVFEPLPPEELRIRIADWGDGFYPQGKKIAARGGDWYQLYGAPVGPDSVVNGVLK